LTAGQLDEWEAELRLIGERILSTDWESVRPVRIEDVCPDCDFLKLCERYWKRNAETL